ncbi:MAG: histidinol dehydrogenase [Deltaproteobacteria bacterium]|nr:histidinol dehydrogenase [Deltaproteobacteria bacterium]
MSKNIAETVERILSQVQKDGDSAVLSYTWRFDKIRLRASQLEVTDREKKAAWKKADRSVVAALKVAARNIRSFHERQAKLLSPQEWHQKKNGLFVGQRRTPIERVGVYVPGGRAAYPSTVLMNAVPARIAGVSKIVMVSPSSGGEINPHTLVAAEIAGVDQIFKIGGAQAIAALAYGTQTIPKVDKIVGPGNIYVATAKKLVFGEVAIDMVAGPTEVVIIADDSANPLWVATDLMSQAEHDPEARPILISPSARLIREVRRKVEKLVPLSPRKVIMASSFESEGQAILVKNLREACLEANRLAPEHLELMVKSPRKLLPWIKNAGAIFLGNFSPVALGDYAAGPNHVLPTGGTARFSSPLGVSDFLKYSSVIEATPKGLQKLSSVIQKIATAEGLTVHAESVRVRSRR